MNWRSRKVRRLAVAALGPALLAFWFITAPAGTAIQRIVSGGNGGPVARMVCTATDWYESPMVYLGKVPALRRMGDALADGWCELMGAPETTP